MNQSHEHIPIRLALYPSPHGLGHLMRIVHLAQMLHELSPQRYHLFIRSNIDESVRKSLRIGWRDVDTITFSDYNIPIQPTIVQTNPYTLSADQTWDAVRNFDAKAALEQEEKFVRANGIQIVISDCPSVSCVLQVPSILVTNFTFDSILGALRGGEAEDVSLFSQEMTNQYNSADVLIRLPGYIPMPYSGKIMNAPVHFRRASASKYETLRSLNIPELLRSDRKILFHCFGGQPNETFSRLPRLPPHWICLSMTIHAPPNFYLISKDAYIPDIIAATDAVLGKLGWGMCSEVIGNGYKPFIYVPRSEFIEEQGLLEWMEKDHCRLVRMEVDAFEAMDWEDTISQAETFTGSRKGDLTAESWGRNEVSLVNMVDEEVARLLGR